MAEKKSLITLIESLEKSFDEILIILKALGNDKRLKIMVTLLTGEKVFDILKKETKLQKTALSNHLAMLIDSSLIEKPDHGKYKLTDDGDLFIRSLESTFIESDIYKKKKSKSMEKRQFSDAFVKDFFQRV